MTVAFHPFYVGKIRIFHKGCWKSGVTEKHKDIILEAFVDDVRPSEYDVLAMIKPIQGSFSLEKRDEIKDFISRHPTIRRCSSAVIDNKYILETDFFLILMVTVRDENNPGAIRPIELYGQIPKRDIGHRVKEGWEEIYGLFSSQDAFRRCLAYMVSVYGDLIEEISSTCATKPGLQLDPPLLWESIALGKTPCTQYRSSIDLSLKGYAITRELRDDLIDIVTDYFNRAQRLAKKIPPPIWQLLLKFALYLLTGRWLDP